MNRFFRYSAQIISALVVSCCFFTAGHAANVNDTYAIMSLAGDSISTVAFNPTTGTNMDANRKHVLELHNALLDAAAIEAANAAMKAAWPGVKTALLVTPDLDLYKAQNDMFEAPDANKENREFLKSLLTSRAVNYLVLITKFNAATEINFDNIHLGSGNLNGLGFYIDSNTSVRNLDTLEAGTGFLASFAYLKIRLIDAKTLEVVGEVNEKQTSLVGNNNRGETGFRAWNLLTGKEKIALLQTLLGDTMTHAIPRLLPK
jgi:hypothetical protein